MEQIDSTDVAAILAGAAGVAHGTSKPLTKLIETVSAGLGELYRPVGVRRMARAEADALLILAEAQGKAADIEQRAVHRVANKELRRQRNIEGIVKESMRFLPRDVSVDPVSEDWTVQFFEHCQDVSDEQIQSIWARILAGEVAGPGRYSLRTLHALKLLRKEDAALFTNYCKFVWSIESGPCFFISTSDNGSFIPPNYVREIDEIYENEGVELIGRIHLQALNLVSASGPEAIEIRCTDAHPANFRYQDRTISVFANPGYIRGYGWQYMAVHHLTDIGRELVQISGASAHERYFQLIVDSIACYNLRVDVRRQLESEAISP